LRYETGLLTTQQFLDEVKAAAGFTGDLAEFSELFGNIFSPIEPMIQLAKRASSMRYNPVVLSDGSLTQVLRDAL